MAPSSRKISIEELGTHTDDNGAWTVINGSVWDISGFADLHPGGEEVIRNAYGKDATIIYNSIHGPGLAAKHLGREALIGVLDESTLSSEWHASNANSSHEIALATERQSKEELPPLESILNLYDFEKIAQHALSERSWAYSSGASNDSLTHAANVASYRKILFRPRVLTGVKNVDVGTTILGQRYELPIFNSPVSLVKLAHPDGELAIGRAAASFGTATILPTMASFSVEEMVEVLPPGYPFFFQLYVNRERSVTEKLLAEVMAWKPRAILITVDLPVFGKREANERYEYKARQDADARQGKSRKANSATTSAQARSASNAIDPDLQWKDIAWIKLQTGLPIFLKGIQCVADARLAYEHGCSGIYLSNHGGRATDTAPSALLTLMDIQANCPEILAKMEVFVDGGIRRGSDVLKAICLGASAVCLGRPLFYSLVYGQAGVERAFQILKDELAVAMQLNGIKSLSEASPDLINTAALDKFVYRSEGHPWATKIIRNKL